MEKIKQLVNNIDEIYQDIYGFTEYSATSSRKCTERWEKIENIINKYPKNNDKIKILDLGCAQGFFSLKANEIGCNVDAIDIDANNIQLCKKLNKYHKRSVNFQNNTLSLEFVNNLKDDKYDFIFLFSVMHHISNGLGFKKAKKILNELAKKSKCLIIEMAKKEENEYWSYSLPEKVNDWFNDKLFTINISQHCTHLSSIKRPLIFTSKNYIFCNQNFYEFNSCKLKSFDESISYKHKKIFLSNDIIFKVIERDIITSDVIHHSNELKNEKIILSTLLDSPKIIDFYLNVDRIILAREKLKGKLFSDIIKNDSLDKKDIIKKLLNILIDLENKNIFHNDIRPWNILIDTKKNVKLIDFGAIRINNNKDCISNKENTLASSFGFLITLLSSYNQSININIINLLINFAKNKINSYKLMEGIKIIINENEKIFTDYDKKIINQLINYEKEIKFKDILKYYTS